jgi:hypothetical protein
LLVSFLKIEEILMSPMQCINFIKKLGVNLLAQLFELVVLWTLFHLSNGFSDSLTSFRQYAALQCKNAVTDERQTFTFKKATLTLNWLDTSRFVFSNYKGKYNSSSVLCSEPLCVVVIFRIYIRKSYLKAFVFSCYQCCKNPDSFGSVQLSCVMLMKQTC